MVELVASPGLGVAASWAPALGTEGGRAAGAEQSGALSLNTETGEEEAA